MADAKVVVPILLDGDDDNGTSTPADNKSDALTTADGDDANGDGVDGDAEGGDGDEDGDVKDVVARALADALKHRKSRKAVRSNIFTHLLVEALTECGWPKEIVSIVVAYYDLAACYLAVMSHRLCKIWDVYNNELVTSFPIHSACVPQKARVGRTSVPTPEAHMLTASYIHQKSPAHLSQLLTFCSHGTLCTYSFQTTKPPNTAKDSALKLFQPLRVAGVELAPNAVVAPLASQTIVTAAVPNVTKLPIKHAFIPTPIPFPHTAHYVVTSIDDDSNGKPNVRNSTVWAARKFYQPSDVFAPVDGVDWDGGGGAKGGPITCTVPCGSITLNASRFAVAQGSNVSVVKYNTGVYRAPGVSPVSSVCPIGTPVSVMAMLKDGRFVVAGRNHTLMFWDFNSKRQFETAIKLPAGTLATSMLVVEKLIFVGLDSGAILLIDHSTKKVAVTLSDHPSEVWSMVWLNEGFLCSADRDGTIMVHRIQSRGRADFILQFQPFAVAEDDAEEAAAAAAGPAHALEAMVCCQPPELT